MREDEIFYGSKQVINIAWEERKNAGKPANNILSANIGSAGSLTGIKEIVISS